MNQAQINTSETGTQSYSTRFPVDINPAVQHVPLTTPRQYTLQIIRDVAERHGVRVEDVIEGDRRAPNVAAKREAIVAVIKAKPNLSFTQIGQIFRMDHTTAVHHAQIAGLASRKAVAHD